MPSGNLGPILALLGLVLLLVSGWTRQLARRRRPAGAGLARWSFLSAFAAYALILVGLYLLWSQK